MKAGQYIFPPISLISIQYKQHIWLIGKRRLIHFRNFRDFSKFVSILLLYVKKFFIQIKNQTLRKSNVIKLGKWSFRNIKFFYSKLAIIQDEKNKAFEL